LIHVHVGDHNRVHEITYGFSGLSEKNVVNLPRNSAKVNLLAYPKTTFRGNFCRSYKAFYGNLT
jgi:hypothetical protein